MRIVTNIICYVINNLQTIRQLYKACSSHPGSGSSSSSYFNLMSLSKEMWPRYRNIYKVYNSSTSALRNSTSTYGDEGVY